MASLQTYHTWSQDDKDTLCRTTLDKTFKLCRAEAHLDVATKALHNARDALSKVNPSHIPARCVRDMVRVLRGRGKLIALLVWEGLPSPEEGVTWVFPEECSGAFVPHAAGSMDGAQEQSGDKHSEEASDTVTVAPDGVSGGEDEGDSKGKAPPSTSCKIITTTSADNPNKKAKKNKKKKKKAKASAATDLGITSQEHLDRQTQDNNSEPSGAPDTVGPTTIGKEAQNPSNSSDVPMDPAYAKAGTVRAKWKAMGVELSAAEARYIADELNRLRDAGEHQALIRLGGETTVIARLAELAE